MGMFHSFVLSVTTVVLPFCRVLSSVPVRYNTFPSSPFSFSPLLLQNGSLYFSTPIKKERKRTYANDNECYTVISLPFC